MMKRDLRKLANQKFDLLVVGAGIYGSFIAWDAALRGLSVALIDKGDFGNATSANSLKIIHGGLRYLQDLNIIRVRNMVSERKAWLKIAPHLVYPIPFLMPTTREIKRNKTVLQAALKINDMISYDRNNSLEPQKQLPAGQILSKKDFLTRAPGFESRNVTGGAMWYDAQMHSSERLLISVILSAEEKGVVAANYVQATGFLRTGDRIDGVAALDTLTGQEFDIRAEYVVNATGPWTSSLFNSLREYDTEMSFCPSIAINIITRQIVDTYAIGLPSQYFVTTVNGREDRRKRLLFMVPWKGYSIIGTIHAKYSGMPEDINVDEHTINEFLAEINVAYPAARLSREDVYHVHSGLLPAKGEDQSGHSVNLLRESVVYDHEEKDGLSGLISVIGVKYTTARRTAEKTVNLIIHKMGWEDSTCQTSETPLYGGRIHGYSDFVAHAVNCRPHGLDPDVIERLACHFGSEYKQVLAYLDEDSSLRERISDDNAIIKAEIVHVVREEMVHSLSDVVLRRTDLGAAGPPDVGCLKTCADILAVELGWDFARRDQEIKDLMHAYPHNSISQDSQEMSL